jgi:hypothetical protein
VHGIYVNAWTAGSSKKMGELLDLLESTELNAMVIDLRDDGQMYFNMGIPTASQAGSVRLAVRDPHAMMDRLAKHRVYPIARIACFRDAFVPVKFPERAVQVPGKKVWRDRSGHTWLDPYNKENWRYMAGVVDYALRLGFPEIQLDYVRFPSEGASTTQVFPAKKSFSDPNADPDDVIAEFAKYVGEKVHAAGAVYSADVFGIISSSKRDQGIGQTLEKIAKPFDLVNPMIYPSHFAKGEYGIADPSLSPGAIVRKSLEDYRRRIPNKHVRPWLQDFFGYGKPQIQAQIKASQAVGYREYLIWNASNRYTKAAYTTPAKPKAKAGTAPQR